jgi:YkoY family integral membrane protein
MWDIPWSDLPLIGWYILSLIVLEGLLSADNALVLAIMVRHLPPRERKRALRYGIFGAFGFRLVAVLLSAVLMRFWLFKVVGGIYLIYLAAAHFLRHGSEPDEHEGVEGEVPRLVSRRSFWATVVAVEMADLAFSIDSILAAVGMAESLPDRYGEPWKLAIVYIGGVLGIITMRYVAGYFILLLDRFQGLVTAAYLLVAWIGVKLLVGGAHTAEYLDVEMPSWLFWSVMLLILLAGLAWRPSREPHDHAAEAEAFLHESDDSSVDDDAELRAAEHHKLHSRY